MGSANEVTSQLRLPAMLPHPARAALTGFGIDRNRLSNRRPRRPYLPGQVEHPPPQFLGIVDAMPRAVAHPDEAMRWQNPPLFFDQQKVSSHLRPVFRTSLPRRFPFFGNNG